MAVSRAWNVFVPRGHLSNLFFVPVGVLEKNSFSPCTSENSRKLFLYLSSDRANSFPENLRLYSCWQTSTHFIKTLCNHSLRNSVCHNPSNMREKGQNNCLKKRGGKIPQSYLRFTVFQIPPGNITWKDVSINKQLPRISNNEVIFKICYNLLEEQ